MRLVLQLSNNRGLSRLNWEIFPWRVTCCMACLVPQILPSWRSSVIAKSRRNFITILALHLNVSNAFCWPLRMAAHRFFITSYSCKSVQLVECPLANRLSVYSCDLVTFVEAWHLLALTFPRLFRGNRIFRQETLLQKMHNKLDTVWIRL